MILSLAITAWIFGDFLLWIPVAEPLVMSVLKIESIAWLTIGFLFMRFAYIFTQRDKDRMYYLIMFICFSSVPISLFTNLIIFGYTLEFWGYRIIGGPLYGYVTELAVTFPFLYTLMLLVNKYRSSTDSEYRSQLILIISSTTVTLLISYITLIVLPVWFGINSIELSTPALFIHNLFIFIAIHRYKFLSIDLEDVANDLFARIQDAVLILNRHSSVMQMNDSAKRLFNINEVPPMGIEVSSLIEDYSAHLNEDNYETSFYQNYKEGVLAVSQAPVIGAREEIGKIVLVRDITQQKQAESEIKKMNKELASARDEAMTANNSKSQFLANMSHELRTPLNAIIGYSEILEEELKDRDEKSLIHDVQRINSAGKHLAELINDILDLSKIEAGKMEFYCERFDVTEFINNVVAVVTPLIEKNNNQLEVEIEENIGMMSTDLTKLRQILFNLLSNAAKFTEDGIIRLKASKTGDEQSVIRFDINDSGIGMTQEQQLKLFNEFTQADASTTRKFGGTGLGLAISHRFCQMMGGMIFVESIYEQGSTFSVELPVDMKVEN